MPAKSKDSSAYEHERRVMPQNPMSNHTFATADSTWCIDLYRRAGGLLRHTGGSNHGFSTNG